MDLSDYANGIEIVNGMCILLGYLPKVIGKVQKLTIKSGFEFKTNDKTFDILNEYCTDQKSKGEQKRCKAILKRHNLPATAGIRAKSEKDICFVPDKKIVDKTMNNLKLKSSDGTAELTIGGGFFALRIEKTESGHIHQKIMCGTVINHKGEIYLLRHPLGGFPNYLAKVELFINGMIIELDDGVNIGLSYV